MHNETHSHASHLNATNNSTVQIAHLMGAANVVWDFACISLCTNHCTQTSKNEAHKSPLIPEIFHCYQHSKNCRINFIVTQAQNSWYFYDCSLMQGISLMQARFMNHWYICENANKFTHLCRHKDTHTHTYTHSSFFFSSKIMYDRWIVCVHCVCLFVFSSQWSSLSSPYARIRMWHFFVVSFLHHHAVYVVWLPHTLSQCTSAMRKTAQ